MQKYSRDFIRLLENIHSIRDRLIWSSYRIDDSEAVLYSELCAYIKQYEFNIQNPCPVGGKTDISNEVCNYDYARIARRIDLSKEDF